MRQLWVTVPAGEGDRVLGLAQQLNGENLVLFQAQNTKQEVDVVVLNISNDMVGELIQKLEESNLVGITLHPQEVYPFYNKVMKIADQVTQVSQRSPIEVWINGLQSIGSWKGFLGNAVAASIVVWVGMYTNNVFLLVGAMLVAPFAGPAMNFALGTATGNAKMLKRNLVRYFVSLMLTVVFSAMLSLIFQSSLATSTMIQVSEISSLSVLLPLVTGAVGAHSLSQPENNSLVPGSAVGALIAASLAPPAGLVGMSIAIERWDMVVNGLFLLFIQLFAINLSGALVFRFYHQTPQGGQKGHRRIALFWFSLISTALLLASMLIWQFWSTPGFQRASQAQKANAIVQQVIQDNDHINLLEANLRYPRPSIQGQNKLLGTIYVERKPETNLTKDQIEEELTWQIQQQLIQNGYEFPFVTITILDSPQ